MQLPPRLPCSVLGKTACSLHKFLSGCLVVFLNHTMIEDSDRFIKHYAIRVCQGKCRLYKLLANMTLESGNMERRMNLQVWWQLKGVGNSANFGQKLKWTKNIWRKFLVRKLIP